MELWIKFSSAYCAFTQGCQVISQSLVYFRLMFSFFIRYRAVLLWCHRALSPRSHWGPFRPVPSAGTLTLLQSLLVLELPQSEWLDLELVLGQCLVASSLAMLGWLWYELALSLLKHIPIITFSDALTIFTHIQEPISEAAAVLICHSGICPVWSHGTVLFDGCFPYPVCYVKRLSYYTLITNVTTCFIVATKTVPCWCHGNVHFQNFQAPSNKNMYCTNVRNYVIKYMYLTTVGCKVI